MREVTDRLEFAVLCLCMADKSLREKVNVAWFQNRDLARAFDELKAHASGYENLSLVLSAWCGVGWEFERDGNPVEALLEHLEVNNRFVSALWRVHKAAECLSRDDLDAKREFAEWAETRPES